jgi:hypothetical protein
MASSGENEDFDWDEAKSSLTPEDKETVKDQLGVMSQAEVVYRDASYTWEEDIAEKYEQLVKAFGGEESVNQYMEIGGTDTTIAVEQDEEPLFVVYGKDEMYEKPGLFNLGLGTTI